MIVALCDSDSQVYSDTGRESSVEGEGEGEGEGARAHRLGRKIRVVGAEAGRTRVR